MSKWYQQAEAMIKKDKNLQRTLSKFGQILSTKEGKEYLLELYHEYLKKEKAKV